MSGEYKGPYEVDYATYRRCREREKKLQRENAELQRLAERAHLILGERWSEHTDEEGYGPSSLMTDLKKAAEGKALKDITLFNDELVKICDKLTKDVAASEKKGVELQAMVNQLRDAVYHLLEMPYATVARKGAEDQLDKTPYQSLHDHDMEVAERVREACAFQAEAWGGDGISAAEDIRSLDLGEVLA